ncbi:hypothetical protein [Acidocella sp. KAb 2-4]|uniref:hypothetical protein n=1 Tax=Acidocella sp. KAb 2-4 TaxID=2885158 RepID=UPI001D07AA7A|nr:hypothetical protein [Acidocella sp. KAb 2-4]MCB5944209.1 hypothetical protein [Acidocella sp. KAb 2-4]
MVDIDMSETMEKSNLGNGGAQNIFHFGAGREGNRLLGAGWGAPEDGFVWTEGPFSVIDLPPSGVCTNISFSLWGYVPAGHTAQRVIIFANGVMVAMAEVAERTILKADMQNVSSSGSVTLQFFVPNALSPKTAEGVPDDRRLGIALAALVLG